MSETNKDVRNITYKDLDLVHRLIEKCFQIYMKPAEIVNTLLHKAKIEPAFTEPILQRLEEGNPEFFKEYKMRLMLKDQILRYNQLLEGYTEVMGRASQNTVVPNTLASGLQKRSMNYSANYHHQTPQVMSQIQTILNRVAPTTLARGLRTHSTNNYATYQLQIPEVMNQTHMSQNGVVPSILASGSKRRYENNYATYELQTPVMMNQTHMSPNRVAPSTLANGSQRHLVNHSSYPSQTHEVLSQAQMRQNEVFPSTLTYGSQTHLMNEYSAYQQQTPELMSQAQMSQNGVVQPTLANGPQTHSMNEYSAYQQQTPEFMSQAQMSQHGVVPTTLANGPQTHSTYNFSTQHQSPEVPYAASENVQHMITPISNYYADGASFQEESMQYDVGMQGHTGMVSLTQGTSAAGIMNGLNGVDPQVMFGANNDFFEPYNKVISFASIPPYNGGELNTFSSIPPYNGGELNTLPFDEDFSMPETNSFGNSGQVARPFSLSDRAGSNMLNNYSPTPLLGNNANIVAPNQGLNVLATTSNGLATTSNVFCSEGYDSDWSI